MPTYSFYRSTDGEISKRTFGGSTRLLALNTPRGYVPIEGEYDRLSQRVDLETGKVVDYQPPQPDNDHEWHEPTKRWRKRREVVEREQRDVNARARLREIDLELVRPLVELRAGPSEKAEARIAELAAEAAELRKDVISTPEEAARAERLSKP